MPLTCPFFLLFRPIVSAEGSVGLKPACEPADEEFEFDATAEREPSDESERAEGERERECDFLESGREECEATEGVGVERSLEV